MPRKAKAKAPHKPRPKRSGAEQPSKPKRARKQAAKPTELAASTAAPRCGQEDCKVCNPPACNNCASCQESRKHPAWDPAKHCPAAKTLRAQPCPNTAPAPRDDDVDPRKLDKKGPYFKASTEITGVMDALADPTKLEPSDLYALACFKDGLKKSGRLDARWAFLAKIKARGDYDVDDINADDGAQKAIEAAVRGVHFKGGSKPSVEEMSKMGPLEMRTVVRVLSYIASWEHRTKAQMKGRQPLGAPLSDQARGAFVALVEGRKYDGVHVCTSLARSENEPWSKYWQGCLHLLNGGNRSLTGARKRFHELLASLRHGRAIWVCRPEMRAWLKERQCQYQRMMVSTTCHW